MNISKIICTFSSQKIGLLYVNRLLFFPIFIFYILSSPRRSPLFVHYSREKHKGFFYFSFLLSHRWCFYRFVFCFLIFICVCYYFAYLGLLFFSSLLISSLVFFEYYFIVPILTSIYCFMFFSSILFRFYLSLKKIMILSTTIFTCKVVAFNFMNFLQLMDYFLFFK